MEEPREEPREGPREVELVAMLSSADPMLRPPSPPTLPAAVRGERRRARCSSGCSGWRQRSAP